MARISIVIPVYHDWSTLNACLECLARSTFKDIRVFIVDHGPERSPEVEQLMVPPSLDSHILKGSTNLWWAGATNIGIRRALKQQETDYIMLLNDDCCLNEEAISHLVECADATQKSIIAPVQKEAGTNKILVRTAYTAYLLGFPTVIPPTFRERNQGPSISLTSMIAGGRGVLIPRSVFNTVGFLDEQKLPHYGADNDFYIRCKKAGYRLFVSDYAVVYVDSAQTTTASKVGNLSLRQFLATLKNRKSHRNIPDLIQQFRKLYPIPGLFPLGVALNIARYFVIYLLMRSVFLFHHR